MTCSLVHVQIILYFELYVSNSPSRCFSFYRFYYLIVISLIYCHWKTSGQMFLSSLKTEILRKCNGLLAALSKSNACSLSEFVEGDGDTLNAVNHWVLYLEFDL